ncbi:predicted protein [Streptomyces sp. SPB78]|nr:predicted protein [Streptomyces sp. SPB78]
MQQLGACASVPVIAKEPVEHDVKAIVGPSPSKWSRRSRSGARWPVVSPCLLAVVSPPRT